MTPLENSNMVQKVDGQYAVCEEVFVVPRSGYFQMSVHSSVLSVVTAFLPFPSWVICP